MNDRGGSDRADALAARLGEAGARLVAVVEPIDEASWSHVSAPGVWSIGKEAEHICEATARHQWIVHTTIGERVSSRKPRIERALMTTDRSPAEMVALIREWTDVGVRLVRALTDAQLDLPTKPPRARGQRLAQTIEEVLIGHYDGHRREILTKLAALSA